MNKPTNKPLTYNRFRAYLRIKLKNKSFSKTRVFLIIAVYILLSLTIFLLPHNVLTQYPYLKYFTDFMDFVPAIKQMEIKTFAPEMCKLYASYMFVVGVIVFLLLFRELFIFAIKRIMYPSSYKKILNYILPQPIKYTLYLIVWNLGCSWYICEFLSGYIIGHSKYRNGDEYFIYNSVEMLYYCLFYMGFMFVATLALTIVNNIVYFDIFKHNWSKIQWRMKKKT